MQSKPENANENCPGVEDKNAGKGNACEGIEIFTYIVS
jgi:hypothetical protein